MANAKCRSCNRSAGAGAYCSSCAAAIMAKALDSFFGRRRKKSPRSEPPRPSTPSLNAASSEPVRTIVRRLPPYIPGRPADPARALGPRETPESCPRAFHLPCTIITLIVHGTTSPGPLPSTLFFAREPMFPRERQRPFRRLRLSVILESNPGKFHPNQPCAHPSTRAIVGVSLSKG